MVTLYYSAVFIGYCDGALFVTMYRVGIQLSKVSIDHNCNIFGTCEKLLRRTFVQFHNCHHIKSSQKSHKYSKYYFYQIVNITVYRANLFKDFGAPLENELLTLNCLSRETDRVDYAEYVFSGKIFVKDDRPAVCANPTRRRGDSGNRVQGDPAPCSKPPDDVDLKLCFSIRSCY